MKFPNDFFYDEVKEGFYVSSIMKYVRAAEMEVLDQFAQVCRKHNLKWFADCGTLLGAVRHGGYIPWDDDLDVCMLRDDYERFHKYAVQDLPPEFDVRTFENGENWQIKTHLVNSRVMLKTDEELVRTHGCPFRVGIDIFVLDYLAQDEGEEEVRRNLIKAVLAIADNGEGEGDFSEETLELLEMAEKVCNVELDRSKHLRRQIYGLAEKLASLYPADGAKYVALMPFWAAYHDHKYPIELVNKVVQIPYENIMINVPAGYDGALKVEYGDYLRVCRKGGMHDYPIFQDQLETYVRQAEVADLFDYIFDPDDLVPCREPKPIRIKQKALDLCKILRKMNDLLMINWGNTGNEVLPVLEKCQDIAIGIGNEIEKHEGNECVTIRRIEDYCESLYEAAVAIEDGDAESITTSFGKLTESLKQFSDSVERDLPDRKEILFLPFRAHQWECFDDIYKDAVSDPSNNVIVMPVPFYDRNFLGKLGEMHYETDGYPDYVKLTDYRTYDIQAHHPDMIYTQYAYDVFHCSYTLPTAYYTAELKKYTEELIYVPYFKIGEYDPEDEKLRQTTRYFVKIPGLMHADKVIVESMHMRDLYIQELINFCGEETRDVWEKKIIPLKQVCAVDDTKSEEISIPDEWKRIVYDECGEKKKVILYMITVSSLYQYQGKMIEKMRAVLQTFYDQRDKIALIFHPHPSIQNSMDLFERNTWLDYRKIVDEYRQAGWGILDESIDASDAIAVADAYYGDADVVMHKCRNLKKPVMIENADIM